MSIIVTYDVECDWPDCLLWANGETGRLVPRGPGGPVANVTASEARINAERQGFSRRRLPDGSMGDVCWEHRRKT